MTEVREKYGSPIKIKEFDYGINAFLSPHNRRIRLMEYKGPKLDRALGKLEQIASRHEFATKIFAKVRLKDKEEFQRNGYRIEALITGYYNGEDALVMSRFLDRKREDVPREMAEQEENVERIVLVTRGNYNLQQLKLPGGYRFVIAASSEHFQQLAQLYRKVFETYPFAIFDPGYLEETAHTHIVYGLVYDDNGDLVAAASAEINHKYNNAEMTDFATLPSQRGKGLALRLLKKLEGEARERGIKCFYTIARSCSVGMNKVFKKAGYQFTGKLIKNCNISGKLENMSVWCKY